MKTLGNILWHFPFFGFISAAIVYLFGLLFTATVVAAPVGLGLMEFGKFLFAPFGHAMVSKSDLNIEQNKAWKTYSTIVMVLYFPFGLFFAIVAIFQVVGLCLSIFGIPVALVIAKSLGTYLNPVNKKCVSSAVATELERRKGVAEVEKYLDPGDGKKQVQSASTQSATDQQPSAVQPEPSQFSTAAPTLSATLPEAEMPPDIPSERSSSTRANGPATPKWLMPAVAGGVILVLVAGGGMAYYKKTQRDTELLAQQELQQFAAAQVIATQKEEEVRRLAEQVARMEAENRAREENQRLQAELRQQASHRAQQQEKLVREQSLEQAMHSAPNSNEPLVAKNSIEQQPNSLRSTPEDLSFGLMRNLVTEYYNTHSEWTGTFTMGNVKRWRLEDVGGSYRKRAHVEYGYVPIPGNRQGRMVTGFDQRTFDFVWMNGSWRVARMGGYMSARL